MRTAAPSGEGLATLERGAWSAPALLPPTAGPAMPIAAAPLPALRVGLLNNMPDTALVQTEWQFRRLVGPDVELRLFAFRDTPRGALAAAHLDAHYAPHEALASAGLDALIITGSEPRLANLAEEPYFAALGAVVDWAAANTASTLFSCLAAHAAVLHLDGIRRKRLPAKISGVFPCVPTGPHPLTSGMPDRVEMPHSRWHDLAQDDLVASGYTVLTRSDDVGVDLFLRDGRSLFVFLQGHPEYEADSLAREHRRDLARFLDGSSATCPAVPANYYASDAALAIEAIVARAKGARDPGAPEPVPLFDRLPLRPSDWPDTAAVLFGNWLSCVAARRSPDVRRGSATG